jgi:hypothetical protein
MTSSLVSITKYEEVYPSWQLDMSPYNSSSWGGRAGNSYDNYSNYKNNLGMSKMVGVVGTNWNQVKRELIAMWQIVKQVREETVVTV